ncbi:Ig-like domain-containing protein [Paenibacillus sp. 1P07SE]|uniref:Ig-like domain-containing protein n=1 Tax=Paenibacillus sp. 1P07SE TaxID=3132209 RepID=UPI0039A63035
MARNKRWLVGLLALSLVWTGLPLPGVQAMAEPASGAAIFVAPNGSDSNTGSEQEPLLTLEGARDAIRELKSGSGLPDGGITVYLREGVYERTATFELNEADSGTADAQVVYRSYPGETVRLSGGKQLDSVGFEPVSDPDVLARIIDTGARSQVLQFDLAAAGITDYGEMSRHGYWKANDLSLVPPMELYIGGEGMTLARWPNEGTVQMNEIVDPGPTVKDPDVHERGGTFSYTYDRPRYWTQAEDIWLDGIFGYSWEWSYNKVANIDTASKTITLQHGEMSGLLKNWYPDFHFAQNLLEELDMPGEYYIDRTAGILYLMPNAAFRSGAAEATVTMLKTPMLRTTGASHIRFEELALEYGRDVAAVILGGSHVEIISSDISNFTNGGVRINAPGRYAYDGVESDRNGRHHAIISSHIRHVGGTAVTLHGGSSETLEPGNNRVENSHIHDFAYYHKAYNPGVLFSGVGNQAIGNEIHDAPHPGIVLYGNDHLIEYNNIYDICKEFQDLGAIYMNAGMVPQERGTVIRRNYFHHIGEHLHGVEGIYPDNMTMEMTIEENIFYKMGNSAIKSNTGSYIYAANNMFIDTYVPYDNYEMFMSREPDNRVDRDYMPAWLDLFERYNNFEGSVYAEKYPALLTFFEEDRYFPTTNDFKNNVIYNPTLTRSNQTNAHGARDIHNLLNYENNWVASGNPGFVDPAAGDFRLTEDAEVFSRIPGFVEIPFEDIGTQGKVGVPHSPDTIDVTDVYLPAGDVTMSIGQTVSLRAEIVPWNATDTGVTYSSSDPSIAEVDGDGKVTGLLPGTAVITVVSAANPALTAEASVTVTEGEGILHFTDFESGGNGWLVDANHSIVPDDTGNRWYRIVNGANSQHPRMFGDYELTYRLRTPAVMPEGGVLIMYDRNGERGSGHIRYRHSESGSSWILFNAQWGTLKEVLLPGAGLAAGTDYEVRVIAQGPSIRVFVDGELVIDGDNPSHSQAGRLGFYVEGFAHLEFDDITVSIIRVPVSGIELAQEQLLLAPGERRRVEAAITPADATDRRLVWQSSDPGVAVIEADGTIRGVAPGTAVVTASSAAYPAITDTLEVTVEAQQAYPVIALDEHLARSGDWIGGEGLTFGEGTVRLAGDGVYGYGGERFGSGLLRFRAHFGAFGTGWYGFALRSDRTGDPTWVGANKGYLVVIKADQIEFQTWKPGQTMVEVIPNTSVLPEQEHEIEIGAIDEEDGIRFILRVDGVTVLNILDADASNPITAEGYLNVYHYTGAANTLELKPARTLSELRLDPAQVELAPGATRQAAVEAVYSDGSAEQLSNGVVFTTGDAAVATVNSNGLLTAVASGETKLIATYGGLSAEATVKVTGGGGGGGSGTIYYPPYVPPQEPEEEPEQEAGDGVRVLRAEDLAEINDGGAAVVRLEPGETALRLSAELLSQLEGALAVSSGPLTLTFPREALNAIAADKTRGDAAKQARDISGQGASAAEPTDKPEAGDVLITIDEQMMALPQPAGAAHRYHAAGSPYRLGLFTVRDDVRTAYEQPLPEPVLLTLSLDQFDKPKAWLGLYRATAEGAWTYEGGATAPNGQTFDAELTVPEVAAVLAYEANYADLPSGHWAQDAVKALSARHIVTGRSGDRFDPAAATTRAEFAALLVRALGLSTAETATPFSDVQPGAWHASVVTAAYQAGLILGEEDGTFAPERTITREEIAMMLLRAYAYATDQAAAPAGSLPSDLPSASGWARTAITEAVGIGLMQGYPGGEFRPAQTARRDETAQTIYNLLQSLQDTTNASF